MYTRQMNPIGKRREKQKAETRELILDCARSLFETVGYEKTTIRAVATKAEIGLGTIYKHFSNKAELLAAALFSDLTCLYESATSSIPADVPIKQQFLHIARLFYNYYTSRPALSKAYFTNLFSMDLQGVSLLNTFDEAYLETITQLVAQAQKKGEISPDRDCAYVAMSFTANYFYVLGTYFLRYNETDPEKMLSILEKLLDQTVP